MTREGAGPSARRSLPSGEITPLALRAAVSAADQQMMILRRGARSEIISPPKIGDRRHEVFSPDFHPLDKASAPESGSGSLDKPGSSLIGELTFTSSASRTGLGSVVTFPNASILMQVPFAQRKWDSVVNSGRDCITSFPASTACCPNCCLNTKCITKRHEFIH